MVAFIIIAGIVLTVVFAWAWVKFVYWLLPSKKKVVVENPYIHSHLLRRANDMAYEEYLDWLDKTGGGLPIEKLKSKEELEFERELNKSI